jgi:hypothetical protein
MVLVLIAHLLCNGRSMSALYLFRRAALLA